MNEMIMSPTEECIPVMLGFSEGASCQLKKDCDRDRWSCDFSAVDAFPLAMSYVPMQKFKTVTAASSYFRLVKKPMQVSMSIAEQQTPFPRTLTLSTSMIRNICSYSPVTTSTK